MAAMCNLTVVWIMLVIMDSQVYHRVYVGVQCKLNLQYATDLAQNDLVLEHVSEVSGII